MPKTVCVQCSLEIAGRVGDAPIHEPFADFSRKANLSESWHPSSGLDELVAAASLRERADIRHRTDLART